MSTSWFPWWNNKKSAPVEERYSINGAGKGAFVAAFTDDPIDFTMTAEKVVLKKKPRTHKCPADEIHPLEETIFKHTGLKVEQIMDLMKACGWNNVSVGSILRFIEVCDMGFEETGENMLELYAKIVVEKKPPS